MKLIYCHIENFGRLRDFEYVFTDGINEICRGNGWGKSTFAAFLCAMFYGLPGNGKGKSSGAAGDRARYAPWQGGLFGGLLLFETAGREYEVTRFFGKRPSEDSFELRNTETNLPSFDFSEKLGEELFHLDRASFLRTVFIAQQDCETVATDDVNALIGDLADRAGDMGSYASAMKRLTDASNRLTPRRSSGSLYRRAAEAAQLEREAAGRADLEERIQESRDRQRDRRRRLAQLEAELREGEERLYAAEEAVLKAARRRTERPEEPEDRVPQKTASLQTSGIQEGRTSLRSAGERKSRIFRKTAGQQTAEEGKWIFPAGAAGAALLAAGLTEIRSAGTGGGIIAAVLGAVLLAAAILCRKMAENRQREAPGAVSRGENTKRGHEPLPAAGALPSPEPLSSTEPLPAREPLSSTESLSARELLSSTEPMSEREPLSSTEPLPEAHLPEIEELPDFAEEEILLLRRGIRALQEEILSCRSGITEGEGELQALQEDLEEQEEAAFRLKELRVLQAKEEQQYRQITAAASLLAKAKQSMTARYADPVRRAFCGYWEKITGYSAAGIRIDAGANVTVEEMGRQRPTSELSTGYRDLAGICLRVALADAMYRGERPPLILDDPFSNMDDEKTGGALRFLQEEGNRYQIVYMTCSRSRCRTPDPLRDNRDVW